MKRLRWIDRVFKFDIPEGWMPDIIERLRGTTTRLKEITSYISREQSIFRFNNKWSICEHIGHLADLDELHQGRIDDFINSSRHLRPADMSNAKTYEANHNDKSIDELIGRFEKGRTELVTRFESLDDDTQVFQSLHPRLQLPMKPVDMAFFTAEHDDHHLADIRHILKQLNLQLHHT